MLKVKPDKPVDPYVAAVLEHVQAVSGSLGMSCFMIGARALDVQLHNVHGLRTFHPTSDTDFAVAVESWGKFAALKDGLVGTGHFGLDLHATQRVIYDGIYPVDLVPFGGLEQPRGTIVWPPDSAQIMQVQYFAEISAAAEEIEIRPGLISRVASLPGLMLTKIFAWDERRETRDAWNISSLLQNYNAIVDEARLFADENVCRALGYDAVKIGAALLGKDVAAIVPAADLDAMRGVVTRGVENNGLSAQVATGLQVVETDSRITMAEDLLKAFLSGLSRFL